MTVEQFGDPPVPVENSWIFMGQDSLANAVAGLAGIQKEFPQVKCRIVCSQDEIHQFTPQPVLNNNVLILVTIPEGADVNCVDLMRTWSDSLNKTTLI